MNNLRGTFKLTCFWNSVKQCVNASSHLYYTNVYVSNLYRQCSKIITFTRRGSSYVPEIKTAVKHDVKLFQYENPRMFYMLNFSILGQIILWTYLSTFVYSGLKNFPVPKSDMSDDKSWWRTINLGEKKYRYGLAIFGFFIATSVATGGWIYTVKSVRLLVLRKGGRSVTIVTYTPYGKDRTITVPLDMVSCDMSRANAKAWLPIKIKGKKIPYVLDMKGEFLNGPLFDYTAGVKRYIK